jgi:tRNA nucleotidyltransferase (CCA-adding enzyme)
MDMLSDKAIPEPIMLVLNRITACGGQAYIVGGAVRDLILCRDIQDWDIAASLPPAHIQHLFQEFPVVPTGKKFGTVTVYIEGTPVEVTTFRSEGNYTDFRHPDDIQYVDDIMLDLSRRDFTINAMAFNPCLSNPLLDPYGGLCDLKRGIIRTVGNANERFTEDPLRILRGIRFTAQLGFSLEEQTQKSMSLKADLLARVSAERIRDEFSKILLAPYLYESFMLLHELKILKLLIPELHSCFTNSKCRHSISQNTGIHCLNMAAKLKPNLVLRLAALFHDVAQNHHIDTVQTILLGLRFDRKTVHRVNSLLLHHHTLSYECLQSRCSKNRPHCTRDAAYRIRKLLGKLGTRDVFLLLDLYRADLDLDPGNQFTEDNEAEMSPKSASEIIEADRLVKMTEEILRHRDPVKQSDLAINGYDLLEMGIGLKDKRDVGKALHQAYDWVLHHPEWNRKELLLSKLKALYNID